jgi:hypothetical protein
MVLKTMAFERTLASTEEKSTDDAEEITLNEEEETSTSVGEEEENEESLEEDTSTNESEDEESEDEESIEALRAELDQAKSDRDNYKKGMLSAKSKKRAEAGITGDVVAVGDVNEQAVTAVLERRTEKEALVNTINAGHDDYIPELVKDSQYQEIIGYLPRNIDKTSYASIVKGLKLATKMWKSDRGIKDKSTKKSNSLNTSKSGVASGESGKTKKSGNRKIIQKEKGVGTWYN